MAPVLLSLVPLLVPVSVDAYGDRLPPGAVARLGSVRWRCPDPPEHLIWSPDGKYLVGTDGPKSLTVWAYPAGVVVRRFDLSELLPRYSGPVELPPFPWTFTPDQVRWMPDARHLLVYGGENRLVRIDIATGRRERIDTGGHRGVAVAISADGRRALLEVPGREKDGDRWSQLSVLDVNRPGQLHPLWVRRVVSRINRGLMGEEHHPAPDARITGDGRFVVAAAIRQYDESYAVFDLDAGRSWLAPDGAFREISIFPRGRGFLSVDSDYRVVRWAFSPATWLRPVPAAGPVARSREGWSGPWHFSPDGRRMLTVSHRDIGAEKEVEQRVVVLDTATLRAVRQWSYRPGNASLTGRVAPVVQEPVFHAAPTCAVAPDNRTVAVTSSDSPRVRLFDLTTGTELRPFAGHAAAVVTIRRAGSKLISVGSDRVARAWQLPDLARGVRGREIEVFDPWGDDDLPPSPAAGARFKVLYDRDRNRVEARDVETEAIVWEREVPGLPVLQPDRPRTIPTAIDPVWDRIAFAVGPAVTVCDLLTGETVAEVRVPGCWPTAVEFGPQPDTLFVGYHDGQVLVWDLRPRDLPRRPPTDAEFAALWADLGGSPRAAARTRSGFLDDPALTLRWLDAHLRPLERPTDLDIDLWLARLAHPRFAEREEATRLLVRHFDVAGPAVREMLVTTRSTEVEHRLRMVIDRQANLGGDAEVVRLVRAVTFLERLGAPEAARLLARLARGGGVPAVRAAEALVRMKERDKAKSVNQPQSMTAPGASAGR